MKNYCLPLLALIAFVYSCTPARQIAEAQPQKDNVPTFQTWVDPNEDAEEEVASKSPEVKPSQKKESLEESYARFRRESGKTFQAETKAETKEIKQEVKPQYALNQKISSTQPLPAQSDEDKEVIHVYIDSEKPVVVRVIEGSPGGIQTIREVPIPVKSSKYDYPQLKQKASNSSPKVDPKLLKTAPYVEEKPATDDPDDFMMALMEDELEEAKKSMTQTRAATQEEVVEKIQENSRYVPVYISATQSIQIDEELLRTWEKKIVDARMGMESPVRLPRWLLQGLEWVTHAPKAEPKRSQTIMPLYKELQARGHLDDVNLNKMTPVQVVRKIRVLVDELKASQGQLSLR
ncbi:MAG: hypothetical protein AAF696_05985 [Bacteroidota bacterium]